MKGLIAYPARWVAVALALQVLAPAARAQTARATVAFDDGTRLLEQGDFRGAIEAFDRAEATGLGSAALYHNRAVAHYRLDELGPAVLYLKRAERIDRENRFVRHSLDIVSARRVDRFSSLPVPVWKRFQRAVISVVPVQVQIVLGLVIYLVFCTIVLMRLLRDWRGAWIRRARFVSAFFALILIGSALTSSVWPPYGPEAVIVTPEIRLHEQPAGDSRSLELIHEGLVVGVLSRGGGWTLVQLPNGAKGWVRQSELAMI